MEVFSKVMEQVEKFEENVSYVKDDPRFKKKTIIYKLLSVFAMMCLWVAIAVSFVMISRPVEVKTVSKTLRNRDIFLCLDISDSMDELNKNICDDLKKLVKGLDGERFGITIFCGKTVVLVPLTTDYDYVLDEIDKLQKAFEQSTMDMRPLSKASDRQTSCHSSSR